MIFFLFHIEIEGKGGWVIGGGGGGGGGGGREAKGMLPPPLKLLEGLPPPPAPLFLRLWQRRISSKDVDFMLLQCTCICKFCVCSLMSTKSVALLSVIYYNVRCIIFFYESSSKSGESSKITY